MRLVLSRAVVAGLFSVSTGVAGSSVESVWRSLVSGSDGLHSPLLVLPILMLLLPSPLPELSLKELMVADSGGTMTVMPR